MSRDVVIEAISTGHPDFLFREFVTLVNQSGRNIDLNGWLVVWTELPTGRELHRSVFTWDNSRPFKPGRKLFLVSGIEYSAFYEAGKNPRCPIAHWLIFTGSRKHICSVPHVKVTLYDANGVEVDHRYSRQWRDEPNARPAIAIGHGGNPAWRDLKDYLHDQLKFEVETFETEPRAGQTVPDVRCIVP